MCNLYTIPPGDPKHHVLTTEQGVLSHTDQSDQEEGVYFAEWFVASSASLVLRSG